MLIAIATMEAATLIALVFRPIIITDTKGQAHLVEYGVVAIAVSPS